MYFPILISFHFLLIICHFFWILCSDSYLVLLCVLNNCCCFEIRFRRASNTIRSMKRENKIIRYLRTIIPNFFPVCRRSELAKALGWRKEFRSTVADKEDLAKELGSPFSGLVAGPA